MMDWRCYRLDAEGKRIPGKEILITQASEYQAAAFAAEVFDEWEERWHRIEVVGAGFKPMRFNVQCTVVRHYTAMNRQIIEEPHDHD